MPAESKKQQQASGIALKAKRAGKCSDLPKGSASRQMCESMSIEELEKFAGTKTKGLPEKIVHKRVKKRLKRVFG